MAIFYTIGNINMNTVNLVANAIKQYFSENAFDKMMLLALESIL